MAKQGSSGSSRYKADYPSDCLTGEEVVAGTVTGGLTLLLPSGVECKLTDTKTGESKTGYGWTKGGAHEDAHSKFKK